jgi:flagellar protein FlgJ
MTSPTANTKDLSSKFALDVRDMGSLKQSARAGSPDALKTAATQFEAMFVNMMLKSMREATPQDGMMDSQQSKMFHHHAGPADQPEHRQEGHRPGRYAGAPAVGQADARRTGHRRRAGRPQQRRQRRQLQRHGQPHGRQAAARDCGGRQQPPPPPTLPATDSTNKGSQAPHVRSFQEKLAAHAEEASKATGIPAKFMLGQAALESGWGKREIKGRDGTNSHNLFGIKATPTGRARWLKPPPPNTSTARRRPGWNASAPTTAMPTASRTMPNCWQVIHVTKKCWPAPATPPVLPRACSKAGYATDPNYATKLASIIKRSLAG